VRLLWISDSPTTPSGFATVTREVCRRLRDRGHRIEILGWQTRGASTWWEGMPVHPVRHDQFGADVLLGYLMRVRPDYVVSLADVWWTGFLADPQIQAFLDMSGTRWVHYYPVDGATPEGVLPKGWAELLRIADVAIAMSRYGQEISQASGVEAGYVPHGVDCSLFRPPADKQAAKAALNYDGRFVILSDARNQPRKMLPRTLDILRLLASDERYDDVALHLHCDPNDEAANSELYSYSILHDLETLGLLGRVRFTAGFEMRPGGGVTMPELARLYQAADVHLLCSYGEGFGLPTLQAAAAGVVPLAVDASASRELLQGHGSAVPVESTMRDEFGIVRTLLSREAAATAVARYHDDPVTLTEAPSATAGTRSPTNGSITSPTPRPGTAPCGRGATPL
jgi:glycosyltransferase involved in cell wall biosynthesis